MSLIIFRAKGTQLTIGPYEPDQQGFPEKAFLESLKKAGTE